MRVLIMAGGTGGHIYPGLAVAAGLREAGAEVRWLGTRNGLEAKLVPAAGIAIDWVQISGVRGKNLLTTVLMPLRLLRAVWQCLGVMRRFQPQVVLGLGGYVAAPGGLAAAIVGRPLLIHEQNARAGSTNRLLARFARRVFCAYDAAFTTSPKTEVVGNPVREAILRIPSPEERGVGGRRPLRVLVLGGSQGAQVLNTEVPRAIAGLPESSRPQLVHQAGRTLEAAQKAYVDAGLATQPVAYIEDMQAAYAEADLVICRAGALSLAEIMAAGLPAICVPLPHAIDDHQTENARHLVAAGGAWLLPESELRAGALLGLLSEIIAEPDILLKKAQAAYSAARRDATEVLVAACMGYAEVAA